MRFAGPRVLRDGKVMTDDTELLRRYADENAQEAFAELVRRHLDFVYSAALRQLNGDAHLAADAAQLVFTDLARKAGALAGHRVLAGWLFTSTRFAAAKLVRGEQRRRGREQEAFRMETINRDDASPPLDWERVRPVLDAALGELNAADREAILLRFFEGRDYARIGASLNVNDNTARMRVDRALDKLRGELARRGITSTSAALAAALTGHSVVAAPAGLAATITGAALAGVGAATAGLTGATFMSITKVQVGLAAALGVAGVTGYVLQADAGARRQEELAQLQRERTAVARLQDENLRLTRQQSEADALRAAATTAEALRAEEAALNARASAVRVVPPPAPRRAPERVALTGEVFDISRLDEKPKAVSQTRPMYPSELRQAGVTGSVVVDFVVMADGTVRNAFALRSTEPRLEAAAVEAVSQWTFDPGRKGGNAVQTRLQIPIVFTVAKNDDAAKSPAGKSRPSPTAPWF